MECLLLTVRKIGLLEGIVLQIEQLVVSALELQSSPMRRDLRQGVVDDLPFPVAPGRKVVAAMGSMRMMHQKLLGTRGIGRSAEEGFE